MVRFSRLLVSATLLASALSVSAQQPESKQQSQPTPSQPAPRAVSPTLDMSIEQLEDEGDVLRGQKDFLDAMDYYQTALKRSNTAALHNKAGVCWIQMAHYGEARKEFEIAIKMDKAYPEAYNNLGVTYYQMKQYGGAVREYRRAIKLRETSASFHMNLGSAYFSRKDYNDASKEFARALQIDPMIFEPQPSGGVSLKLPTQGDR